MLQHHEVAMLDLALHRGLLSGYHYGRALMRPANTMKKPKNPYIHPVRRAVWWLGFSLGVYDALQDWA
jgi:hypothetical protein